MPEPYRIPGDALELAVYKLDDAQARIQELEQEVEFWKTERTYLEKAQARIRELEQEVERLDNVVDELCVDIMKFESDRDNWRAKAEG